jgi:hypothetical protein
MFRFASKQDFQLAPPVGPEVDELLRSLYVQTFGRQERAFDP